ncbi:sensor histidine kinase [Cohnella rhizosphaerae]|uniref:histidine kinase n=1 Tax=Cohnella rhizosphaerae TaxID=1457232 RepID=A0A9X4KUI0_9BACL|nr:sensor histidine kinase [Cohnella rhizosphaerae]MDG0811275.1 sensor histidine kinase [Cohnella rhizosphaerae]
MKLLNDAGDGDASLFAVSGPEGGDGEASSVLTRIAAVPRTSWTLESRVSLKEALQPLSALRNRMLITMIVVTAIAYVFAYFYSDLSTKRIKRLSERMRRVQSGDLQVVMTESGKDEIGELVGSFNYMVRRMNGLVQEQFQMGQALKNAELRTLQAQINPHLLYNSLDTINCLAIAHQVPDISRMVRALTQFYKLGLSKGHELVPLRAELQHIRAYIGIMNMRYEHAIELRIEAEPELEACLVLRTMLQPIVENAVYHGILETERKRGTIVVAAALETDRTLCVIVRDDGRGMTADQAARLFERPSDDSREGGFGLLNVNDRIRLTFGEAYGLSAESRPDSGTVIRLRLPGDLSRPA